MAESGALFRTSVGGFNKSDVLSYLDKQNADFREQSEKQQSAIAEKDKEIESLKKQIEELKKELDSRGVDSQAPAVKTDVKPGASSEFERKAELYDDMSGRVGDILISANKSAESIIAEANRKAADINAGAAANAAERRSSFSSNVENISNKAQENTRAIAEDFRSDLSAELNNIRELISAALENIDERALALDEKAGKMHEKMKAELDRTSSAIDGEIEKLKTIK